MWFVQVKKANILFINSKIWLIWKPFYHGVARSCKE